MNRAQTPAMSTPSPTVMTDPAQPPASRFGHLPTLDGWRAVAILMVMAAHTGISAQFGATRLGERLAYVFDATGYNGVQVFFAISGFLICSRLLHERRTTGRIGLGVFYVRRAFRILPASMAFLATVAVLMWAGAVPGRPMEWWSAMGSYSNYVRPRTWCLQHFWSLAVEEHFYLVWPTLVLLTARKRWGLATAVGLAVAITAWRLVIFKLKLWPIDGTFATRTDTRADGLLWGCAAAFLYADERVRGRLATWLRTPGWTGLLVLVVAVSLWPIHDWKVRQVPVLLVRLLVPAVIVGTVLHPRSWAGRLLDSWPMRAVGWISYSLYLWQELFIWSLPEARPAWLARVQVGPLPWVLTFACAVASYCVVEQPLVNVGHRLTRRRRPATPTTGPATAAPSLVTA